MESLEIKSVDGESSITFLAREPSDTSKTADYFVVQLRGPNLNASARVYVYMCKELPELFAHVARNWQDFTGPRAWSSLEREFTLEISHDGLGHFTISAVLHSGLYDRDWRVNSHVMVETSQLDRIALDIAQFVGQHE